MSNGFPPPPQPKPRTLFLDVYGPFVRRLGGWIATGDLVSLMGDLGVPANAVRVTASRMTKDGLLERTPGPGRASGYALSPKLRRALELGDRRIFEAQRPASLADGWVVVTFSIPEADRKLRHQLRSRLVWLGFGSPSPGVWLAPQRLLPDVKAVVSHFGLQPYVDFFSARYEGTGSVPELVGRAWNLEELGRMYTDFLARHQPALERWRTPPAPDEGRQAFIDYVFTLTQWRRLPFLDPGLPPELLPDGWPGHEASRAFLSLARTLGPGAFHYVRQVMGLPDTGQQLARLHGGP